MFLLLAAVLSLASAAEPVALPGSEVRLPLEPGFEAAASTLRRVPAAP